MTAGPLRGLASSIGVAAAASFGWLLWPGEVTRALALVTLVLVARDTAAVVTSRRKCGPPQRRRVPRRDDGTPATWIFRGESPPDSILTVPADGGPSSASLRSAWLRWIYGARVRSPRQIASDRDIFRGNVT